MQKLVSAIALASVLSATPALAKNVLQPVPVGAETLRFRKGVPTLDLQEPHGGVQVTPLPMDHGSYAFAVAVLNNGPDPANIDISNFDIISGTQHIGVFSVNQLKKKANKRAMWATIALAAAGGLAAAAASNERDYYHATTYTPHGTYHTVISTPSASGQVEAAAAAASAGAGIAVVQSRLDQTRAALGDSTIQMTTVDPGDSYSGRIVIDKVKCNAVPQRIDFVVNWNGDRYPFAFQIVKDGTPQPVFSSRPIPVAPDNGAPAPAVAPAVPSAPTITPAVATTIKS